MADAADVTRAGKVAGLVLMVLGGVGVVTGAVALAVLTLHVLGVDVRIPPEHWASHGPAAMGMGVDWAMLSSACGVWLGGLLWASGVGWRRGRPWAFLVTVVYGLNGMVVCGVDLVLFGLFATAGPMRTAMLVADGVAFAVAASSLAGALAWRRRSRASV